MSELNIKFRGKSIKTNKWVYGYYVCSGDGGYESKEKIHWIFSGIAGYGLSEGLILECNEVYPDSVSLYSGYKDKNGIEIYSDSVMESTQQLYTHFGNMPTGKFFKHTIGISYENGYWVRTELTDERWNENWNNEGEQGKIYWNILLKYYTVIEED